VERPPHLLLLHHPLADEGIHCRLGEDRGNAEPGSVTLSIVDNRTSVRADIGQELNAEAVQPCDREPALMSVVNALGARKLPFQRSGCSC
jgi:hypothetical protein